jgi:hypothetical protein
VYLGIGQVEGGRLEAQWASLLGSLLHLRNIAQQYSVGLIASVLIEGIGRVLWYNEEEVGRLQVGDVGAL